MSHTEHWNDLLAAAERYQSRGKSAEARTTYQQIVACFNDAAQSYGDRNEMERQELRELIADLESHQRVPDAFSYSIEGDLAALRSRLAESEQNQEPSPAPPIVWRLLGLDAASRRALLLAELAVASKPYHDRHTATVWADCTLRQWLNGEFAAAAFSGWQRERIALSSVENPDNPTSGLRGGPATEDHVFLLSIAEAERLFAADKNRVATYQGRAVWWWLRSPGDVANSAAGVIPDGKVNRDGDYVSHRGGVRPAVYLNLQPVDL
jgi:hypothetical protein